MKLLLRLLVCLHAFFMRLYPRQFRGEFSDEMTTVFTLAVQEAGRRGIRWTLTVWLRELRDLPSSLAQLHWHNFGQGPGPVTGKHKPGRLFYPGCLLATALSIPLAAGFSLVIIAVVIRVLGGTVQVGGRTGPTEDLLLNYIFFPVLGLSTGCLQWLLLRRYFPRVGRWVLATFLGWSLAAIVVFRILFISFHFTYDPIWFTALMFLMIGFSIGLAQWLVLRRHVPRAGWWILANIAGWSIAMWAVEGISTSTGNPAEFLTYALLPAIVTSMVLWLLLDRMKGGTFEASL